MADNMHPKAISHIIRARVHPQTNSILFKLAAELRNIIYKELFTDIVTDIPSNWCDDDVEEEYFPEGLLVACKQTYSETTQLYYKLTTFRFVDYHSGGIPWLIRKPVEYVRLITNFEYKLDADDIEESLAKESTFAIQDYYCSKLLNRLKKMRVLLQERAVWVCLDRGEEGKE